VWGLPRSLRLDRGDRLNLGLLRLDTPRTEPVDLPLNVSLDLMNGVDIAWRRTARNARTACFSLELNNRMTVLSDRENLRATTFDLFYCSVDE